MGIKEKKGRKKIWQYKNQGMEVIKGRGKGSHEGKGPYIGKKETKEGRKEEEQKEEGSRKGWMVTVSKRYNRKEEKDKKATSKERNRKEESTCSEHQGNEKEVGRKCTR